MNPQQLFRQSLDRCKKRADFLDLFYDHFMASSEQVREKFANTNFAAQKGHLIKSLTLAADVVDGDAAAMRHLHERAESHSRHEINVQPALYDLWLEALLSTVEECDEEFSDQIEAAWRSVLGHIIGYMQAHY